MIITDSRYALVHFISNAGSWNNCYIFFNMNKIKIDSEVIDSGNANIDCISTRFQKLGRVRLLKVLEIVLLMACSGAAPLHVSPT